MTRSARPSVRAPSVAGYFYPDDPLVLARDVDRYLADAAVAGPVPEAIIAPHAGYVYSGPVAASAYARLGPARDRISRVVVLGPSHRMRFQGIALPDATAFATPLGDIPLDRESLRRLEGLPGVVALDAAFDGEHSLEVHLPFLQRALGSFTLAPLIVGEATADEVAAVLEALWGGAETLVVASSDLSHYQDYATAVARDRGTADRIERLDDDAIGPENACGCRPVAGLLRLAARRGLRAITVDLRNSGDTAGGRDRVVGYGAWVLEPTD